MGRPKKIKEVEVQEKPVKKVVEIIPEPEIKKEKVHEAKEEKKERILEILQPGQKYFEAPDGTLIIGEADKQQVFYRQGDNGRGCYINPRR